MNVSMLKMHNKNSGNHEVVPSCSYKQQTMRFPQYILPPKRKK